MNKLIISSHSFVDLITNSSSELFVCNTDKTVETVKEILTELCINYNARDDSTPVDLTNLFTETFGPITVCNYTIKDCSERRLYANITKYWDNTDIDFQNGNALLTYWKQKTPVPIDYASPDYQKYILKETEAIQQFYHVYHQKVRELYHKLLENHCKDSELDYDEVAKDVIEDNSCIILRFSSKGKYQDFIETINESIAYDYTTRKGDIMIVSASDNTIPYDIFDDIAYILNAQHKHLG